MVFKQLHCGSEALVHLCLLPCTDALCMHAAASYYLCIHREALTESGGIIRPVRGAIPYIPIPPLYYGNPSARVFLRGASVRDGALLSAREGPWRVISSPARLHGL